MKISSVNIREVIMAGFFVGLGSVSFCVVMWVVAALISAFPIYTYLHLIQKLSGS